MTANSLAKHYDVLKPSERLPALIASHLRGDQVEFDRLMRSAPQLVRESSNVRALILAWRALCDAHLLEMLDHTALYLRIRLAMEGAERDGADANVHKLAGGLKLIAWRLRVESEAWAQFTGENNIDGAAMLDGLPGAGTLAQMFAEVPELGPQAEAVRALLPPEEQGDLITMARCLDRWRERLDSELDLHGDGE